VTEPDQLAVHPAKLMQLKAEARLAHERFETYKHEAAKSRSWSRNELRELKQACDYADARLARARRGSPG
jgi:hypothetical protein